MAWGTEEARSKGIRIAKSWKGKYLKKWQLVFWVKSFILYYSFLFFSFLWYYTLFANCHFDRKTVKLVFCKSRLTLWHFKLWITLSRTGPLLILLLKLNKLLVKFNSLVRLILKFVKFWEITQFVFAWDFCKCYTTITIYIPLYHFVWFSIFAFSPPSTSLLVSLYLPRIDRSTLWPRRLHQR